MEHFRDEGLQDVDVKVQLVQRGRILEMAFDHEGLERDCLCGFYDQSATGNALKLLFKSLPTSFNNE